MSSLIAYSHLQDGSHAQSITIKFQLNNKYVILDLNLNENLLPVGHFMRYQLPSGDKIIEIMKKTDIDLCHYNVSTYTTIILFA